VETHAGLRELGEINFGGKIMNKETAMVADCYNWYSKLKWWEKILCDVFRLRGLYQFAYADGWDSLYNLLSAKEQNLHPPTAAPCQPSQEESHTTKE
jgi:hypothetical protein